MRSKLSSGYLANSQSALTLTVSTVCNLIHLFLMGDTDASNLLKFTSIWVLPLMNPDGYGFVREKFNNKENIRLEQLEDYFKNTNSHDSQCPDTEAGINLRNNFNFKFNFNDKGSEGDNKCAYNYSGPISFSEEETKFFKEFIEQLEEEGQSISLVMSIDSHRLINAIVTPNNYIQDKENSLLRGEDFQHYIFYKGVGDLDINIPFGNSMKVFGRPNNGDMDDWLLHTKNLLSLSLYVAPVEFIELHQSGKGTVFLSKNERIQVIKRNLPLIQFIMKMSSAFLQFPLERDPFVCEHDSTGELSNICQGFQSTPYDLYLGVSIDIENIGEEDISENVLLEFKTQLPLEILKTRQAQRSPYLETPYHKDSSSEWSSLQLDDITKEKQKTLGLIFILHVSTDIQSQQDLENFNLGSKEITLKVIYGEGVGSESFKYDIDVDRLFRNFIQSQDLSQGVALKASEGVLYAFLVWFLVITVTVVLQLSCNVFRVNKRREDDYVLSKYMFELKEIKPLKNSKGYGKDRDLYQLETMSAMSGPSNPFDLKDSRYLHTDEGPNYDRSSHLTVSALNPNKENNSTNKKSNQLNIEVSLNAYDSNQSTNRLNPDSNRNLLMSTRNSKFVSTPGSDNHNFDSCTTSQRSQGQELPQSPSIFALNSRRKLRKNRVKDKQTGLSEIPEEEKPFEQASQLAESISQKQFAVHSKKHNKLKVVTEKNEERPDSGSPIIRPLKPPKRKPRSKDSDHDLFVKRVKEQQKLSKTKPKFLCNIQSKITEEENEDYSFVAEQHNSNKQQNSLFPSPPKYDKQAIIQSLSCSPKKKENNFFASDSFEGDNDDKKHEDSLFEDKPAEVQHQEHEWGSQLHSINEISVVEQKATSEDEEAHEF